MAKPFEPYENYLGRGVVGAYYLTDDGYRGEGLPANHPNRKRSFLIIVADDQGYSIAISDMAEGADPAAPRTVITLARRLLALAGY